MGISEAHNIFKEALGSRHKFDRAAKGLEEAASSLFPSIEAARILLGKAKSAAPGTPQRSAHLREFSNALAACAADSTKIRDASQEIAVILEEIGKSLGRSQTALVSDPLN
jgi:hypothetical protein